MTTALCLYAFEALQAELGGTAVRPLVTFGKTDSLPAKAPLFVTWEKHSDLRGCIGTFSPQPVEAGVARFAVTAAVNDSRFPPVTAAELPALECSVTLLHTFEPITDPLDWQVGRHGLKIDYGHYYSGTFLPSVAEEQEWDQVDTLYHLLRKAGISPPARADTTAFYARHLGDGTLTMERYQGAKASASYGEYAKY